MNKSDGFVMLEVLIDCALIGIAGIIAGHFVTLAEQNAIANHYVTAIYIAQDELEKLRLNDFAIDDSRRITVIKNNQLYEVELEESVIGDMGVLEQAAVAVSWQGILKKHQYKLITVFRKEQPIDEAG